MVNIYERTIHPEFTLSCTCPEKNYLRGFEGPRLAPIRKDFFPPFDQSHLRDFRKCRYSFPIRQFGASAIWATFTKSINLDYQTYSDIRLLPIDINRGRFELRLLVSNLNYGCGMSLTKPPNSSLSISPCFPSFLGWAERKLCSNAVPAVSSPANWVTVQPFAHPFLASPPAPPQIASVRRSTMAAPVH